MEENNYKCASCGASLKKENKTCEYCGSVNQFYKEELLADEITDEEDTDFSVGEILGDILGGVMGGMMIGAGAHRRRQPRPRDGRNRPPRRW